MKIRVRLEVSERTSVQNFDLEDLNLTAVEWSILSEQERRDIIQNLVDELPSQPCWIVYSFDEF
jgi:hypothetical protein